MYAPINTNVINATSPLAAAAAAAVQDISAADRLTAYAVRAACDSDGTLHLPNGRDRVALIDSVFAQHSDCHTFALRQHVATRLNRYAQYYAPGPDWQLIVAEPDAGWLIWRHRNERRLSPVFDVLTSARSETVRISTFGGVVTRVCDLVDHRDARLRFPGETRTWDWRPADDPIHRGLSAQFPDGLNGKGLSA